MNDHAIKMNTKQIAIVLYQLHIENNLNIEEVLNKKLDNFNLSSEEKLNYSDKLKTKYLNGIKHLNSNQLKNIISRINSDGYNNELIKSRSLDS